jgi:hypothetical protein
VRQVSRASQRQPHGPSQTPSSAQNRRLSKPLKPGLCRTLVSVVLGQPALLKRQAKRTSLKTSRKGVLSSNAVKLYSYHRYVVIDEIEYELDVTKVTASVNPCSPGTRLFASGRSLTPSVAPPRARGERSGRRASCQRPRRPGRTPQKRGLPGATPPPPAEGRSRSAAATPRW